MGSPLTGATTGSVMMPGASDVGKRVSVRVVDADGSTRDLVGTLISPTTVKRRDESEVEFDPAAISHWRIVAMKLPTAGTGAPLSLRVREIEAAAACTWPAEISVMSGGWLLRSSGDVTRRANSALPLGNPPYGGPDSSVEHAIAEVVEFARMHGMRPTIQVALPVYALLDERLAESGWDVASEHHVLVHDTRSIGVSEPATLPRRWTLLHEDEPSDAWRSVQGPDAAAIIMSRWPADYMSLWVDDLPVGVGRLAISDGWGVITRVYVTPASRGRGVGVGVMEALARSALASGVERLALQVSVDNHAALGLYAKLGFRHHHRYRHRMRGALSGSSDSSAHEAPSAHKTHGGYVDHEFDSSR